MNADEHLATQQLNAPIVQVDDVVLARTGGTSKCSLLTRPRRKSTTAFSSQVPSIKVSLSYFDAGSNAILPAPNFQCLKSATHWVLSRSRADLHLGPQFERPPSPLPSLVHLSSLLSALPRFSCSVPRSYRYDFYWQIPRSSPRSQDIYLYICHSLSALIIMATRTGIRRRALGTLQMNVPLWMRQQVKTPAITYDQENELQVDFGIAVGVYDEHEVRALTNYSTTRGVGPANAVADSDDDDGIRTLARDLDHRRWEDRLGRERVGLQGQQSDDDDDDDDVDEEVDDDEMGGHYGELADEDLEPTDEFEYDQQTDMHNHLAANTFDPIAMGLKEINNLAHFSVSSHKPGNGVQELLSDDLDKYWQ